MCGGVMPGVVLPVWSQLSPLWICTKHLGFRPFRVSSCLPWNQADFHHQCRQWVASEQPIPQGLSTKISDFWLKLEVPWLIPGWFPKRCCQTWYLRDICSLLRAVRRIHLFYWLCCCSPSVALSRGCTEQCFLQLFRAGLCPNFYDLLVGFSTFLFASPPCQNLQQEQEVVALYQE